MTIPDELWNKFKKLLPKEKPSRTVGRPIVDYRKVLDGIIYVLRTEGCQWKKSWTMIPFLTFMC
jgi:transposase